jgi:hypothetical protein
MLVPSDIGPPGGPIDSLGIDRLTGNLVRFKVDPERHLGHSRPIMKTLRTGQETPIFTAECPALTSQIYAQAMDLRSSNDRLDTAIPRRGEIALTQVDKLKSFDVRQRT